MLNWKNLRADWRKEEETERKEEGLRSGANTEHGLLFPPVHELSKLKWGRELSRSNWGRLSISALSCAQMFTAHSGVEVEVKASKKTYKQTKLFWSLQHNTFQHPAWRTKNNGQHVWPPDFTIHFISWTNTVYAH